MEIKAERFSDGIQFVVFHIRPEIKFDSREALRLKMQEDIAAARAWFVKRAEEEK